MRESNRNDPKERPHHTEALLLDAAWVVERERPWPLVAPLGGAVDESVLTWRLQRRTRTAVRDQGGQP